MNLKRRFLLENFSALGLLALENCTCCVGRTRRGRGARNGRRGSQGRCRRVGLSLVPLQCGAAGEGPAAGAASVRRGRNLGGSDRTRERRRCCLPCRRGGWRRRRRRRRCWGSLRRKVLPLEVRLERTLLREALPAYRADVTLVLVAEAEKDWL